jgi:hypothetical protein
VHHLVAADRELDDEVLDAQDDVVVIAQLDRAAASH